MSGAYPPYSNMGVETPTLDTADSSWEPSIMQRSMSGATDHSFDSGYRSNPSDLWLTASNECSQYLDTSPVSPMVAEYTPASADTEMYAGDDDVPGLCGTNQFSDMSQLFEGIVGDIYLMAHAASESASYQLDEETSGAGISMYYLTSDVLEGAALSVKENKRYKKLNKSQAAQTTVQCALSKFLYETIRESKFETSDMQQVSSGAIHEAAYQLQRQLRAEGVEDGQEICYQALVGTLMDLQTSLTEEDGAGQAYAPYPIPPPPKATRSRFDAVKYPCLQAGCNQNPFGRMADLDRHYKMVHVDDAEKKKFLCDYKKCTRHTSPFFRIDHFRDHLRDFHKEDLLRRGVTNDENWWSQRAPRENWWRCNRCLTVRVNIHKYGYTCPSCNNQCEEARQKFREQYEKTQ